MRKILITILVIILVILAYFTIFHGISIGSFKILGTSQIEELSDELNSKKDEANRKVASEFQGKQEELLSKVDTLLQNKEQYYDVANVSTDKQLSQANTEEVYNLEYLYLKVGGHARNEGVNLKLDINSGDTEDEEVKNLAFTVTGQYVGIIDFISAIEDDSELSFVIEDFKMEPDEENIKATFNVRGIKIQLDETEQVVETEQESQIQGIIQNMVEN